jgi:hypothetical protein
MVAASEDFLQRRGGITADIGMQNGFLCGYLITGGG